MKLKDISDLIQRLSIPLAKDTGKNTYDEWGRQELIDIINSKAQMALELAEKEIEIDVEKVKHKILESIMYDYSYRGVGSKEMANLYKDQLAKTIAKADIIKMKEG